MTTDTINTLLFTFVALSAIQATLTYCVIKIAVLGKPLTNRVPKDHEYDDRPRIHAANR